MQVLPTLKKFQKCVGKVGQHYISKVGDTDKEMQKEWYTPLSFKNEKTFSLKFPAIVSKFTIWFLVANIVLHTMHLQNVLQKCPYCFAHQKLNLQIMFKFLTLLPIELQNIGTAIFFMHQVFKLTYPQK